jgi:hypothetical protein
LQNINKDITPQQITATILFESAEGGEKEQRGRGRGEREREEFNSTN